MATVYVCMPCLTGIYVQTLWELVMPLTFEDRDSEIRFELQAIVWFKNL